jgi:uncharacterized membrane protein
VRDAVIPNPSPQSTGSFEEVHRTSDFDAQEEASLAGRFGQAVMIVSGAALVALAAKQRSWRTLGAALAGAPLVYRGATGHWPAPQALAQRASEAVATKPVETSLTVGRPAAELYAFWRDLENLPRFMKNLESVTSYGDGRSHWVARSPLKFKVEWDAEIVEEREGQLLSWRSLPGAQVHNAGTVFFEPATGGRGTVVRVNLEYRPAGLGQALARVLRPLTEQEVREDLRRFKSLVEAGEVPTTQGQPAGARPLLHLRSPF